MPRKEILKLEVGHVDLVVVGKQEAGGSGLIPGQEFWVGEAPCSTFELLHRPSAVCGLPQDKGGEGGFRA